MRDTGGYKAFVGGYEPDEYNMGFAHLLFTA